MGRQKVRQPITTVSPRRASFPSLAYSHRFRASLLAVLLPGAFALGLWISRDVGRTPMVVDFGSNVAQKAQRLLDDPRFARLEKTGALISKRPCIVRMATPYGRPMDETFQSVMATVENDRVTSIILKKGDAEPLVAFEQALHFLVAFGFDNESEKLLEAWYLRIEGGNRSEQSEYARTASSKVHSFNVGILKGKAEGMFDVVFEIRFNPPASGKQ